MKLINWEPIKEIGNLLGDRDGFYFPLTRASWELPVDTFEENGNLITKMNLPGLKSEDMDISLEDGLLTVTGQREEEAEVDKKDYYSKEIRRGSFSRTVNLPKEVDSTKAEAKYNDGVLMITAPIIANAKEKAVKINISK